MYSGIRLFKTAFMNTQRQIFVSGIVMLLCCTTTYKLYPKRCNIHEIIVSLSPNRQDMTENRLSLQVKALRKQYGLTQEELSYKSGVGLRFIRDLEQGKNSLRMDKVNTVLAMFGKELGMVNQQRGGEQT